MSFILSREIIADNENNKLSLKTTGGEFIDYFIDEGKYVSLIEAIGNLQSKISSGGFDVSLISTESLAGVCVQITSATPFEMRFDAQGLHENLGFLQKHYNSESLQFLSENAPAGIVRLDNPAKDTGDKTTLAFHRSMSISYNTQSTLKALQKNRRLDFAAITSAQLDALSELWINSIENELLVSMQTGISKTLLDIDPRNIYKFDLTKQKQLVPKLSWKYKPERFDVSLYLKEVT